MIPLAERIRPRSIEEVVGQEHLLGTGKILNRVLASSKISNMIFYGPPGVGKTTVASIIANTTNKRLYKLNATNASVSDIKSIIDGLDSLMAVDGVLLYLDEIQNFNKKQQQSLLEFMENGKITLIASTTENPFHYIYKAILSRSAVYEFKSLTPQHIIKGLKRGLEIIQSDYSNISVSCSEDVLTYIAEKSNGDLRTALNILELAVYSVSPDSLGNIIVEISDAEECTQTKAFNYDNFGDSHYDTLSAFQKSIRGSDPDASIHYLARLIKAGDLPSICRRLLVIASEDIGLAYPNAIVIVKNCIDSAMQIGLPEARIPLAQAVLTLATAPKSNSVVKAIDAALNDLENKDVGDIPETIKDAHYEGASMLNRGINYKYPHDYKNNYVKQQYLPDNIRNAVYYIPGKNKMEAAVENYLSNIKSE